MADERLYLLLDKIDANLQVINARLGAMDIRLAKYNSELEFHVARTTQLEDELLPIVKHVEQVRGATKLAAAIGAIGAFVGSIAWIWGK